MRALDRACRIVLLSSLLIPAVAWAGNTGTEVKKAVKAKAGGTYYLKTNVPYFQGRHAYGTFKKPIVVVTAADGPSIPGSSEVQAGAFHAEARRLALRVNDPVQVDEFEWESEDGSLEIELEGTGHAEGSSGVLKFTGLKSVADFENCWQQTFSDVSIEQKYDWPEEIKKAVVERKVLMGMTPEQVLVAVGNPERVTRTSEGGKPVEIWTIQRGEGGRMGFWTMKVGDKQEMDIRFTDGKVSQIGGDSAAPDVKLK